MRSCVLMACMLLASCAQTTTTIAPRDELFNDTAFDPPTSRVRDKEVFALSPEMRVFLRTQVADEVKAHGLAHGLVQALFSNHRLKLAYDAEFTRNAAEAFQAHAGNCLSLAILTGALANELGLAVRYQAVRIGEHWGHDGDLVELIGHVNVSVGRPLTMVRTFELAPDWWTVDFLPQADIKDQVTQPISEARVAAMYMNNKAAEALARKQTSDAYWWLRAAISADPTQASLYNTLGVTYLRHDQLSLAEKALRFALALEPDRPDAMGNLALVLRKLGRLAEADAIQLARSRSSSAAMFTAYEGGIEAFDAGDYARARDQFARALRRANDFHEIHYWLAVTYLNLGSRDQAIEHLRLAEENSVTRKQRAVYNSKLDLLRSTTSAVMLNPRINLAN